jgi:aminocarboxymuconate-semialdehyde decarboxylase
MTDKTNDKNNGKNKNTNSKPGASRRDLFKGGALAATGLIGGAGEAQAQAKQSFSGARSIAATGSATPWTVPQRKTRPISIDMHTHWAPEPYLKAKAALGQPDFLDPINHDMDRRVKWMDQAGIQTLVLTLGGFRPWVWVTPEQGANIARVTNDAAVEVHTAFPERFVAAIELNCSDAAGSLAELNRMAGKPGMVCIHLPTSLGGKEFLFDAAFAPVLARAEELSLPIFLHPLDGQANWFAGRRLVDVASGVAPDADFNAAANRFPGLTNSLGNSLEIAVTISKLITSGTLDKYPKLTFIAVQGGGAMPYAAGRLANRGRLKKPIGEYLRRFYYDSLVYMPESLRYLAAMVGSDRIVLGTDNMYGPGPQQTDQPHSVIDQANFTDDDRDLILRGNLKRLLKI